MKTDKIFKCLFLANAGIKGEQIGLKDNISLNDAIQYVRKSINNLSSIKINCNEDTLLIPGPFDRQEGIIPINWEKADEKIIFREKDIIPVLLRGFAGKIYYIANMNNEAFDNTMKEGSLWVYSKTNEKIQKKGATSGDFINVEKETFMFGWNQDGDIVGKVDCSPIKKSVCHIKNPKTGKGYETCFFRGIEEIINGRK
ncbi:hypothetical protein HGA92_04775 [Candidatus Gracilibacteria bacterium]|nr:hypothetical protein [Candidatus Gracilibacteria bacterium]NUJ98451.1 hypothetical protein [Candidatus Gracilibacteria bacterium]